MMDGETRNVARSGALTFAAVLGILLGFATCARCEPTKDAQIAAARADVDRLVRLERDAAAAAVVAADKVIAEQRAVIATQDKRIAELEAETQRLNAIVAESDAALLRCDRKLSRSVKWAWAGWGIAGGAITADAIR